MASKIQDQFTTTEAVDAVRATYGDDDTAHVRFDCGKCGGAGRIAYYGQFGASVACEAPAPLHVKGPTIARHDREL